MAPPDEGTSDNRPPATAAGCIEETASEAYMRNDPVTDFSRPEWLEALDDDVDADGDQMAETNGMIASPSTIVRR